MRKKEEPDADAERTGGTGLLLFPKYQIMKMKWAQIAKAKNVQFHSTT
jgi:hypothetical protein